jgi:ribosomal protein L31
MKFECTKCNYCTCKKSNYDKHLTTAKHNTPIFQCKTCNKVYTTKSGLWKHEHEQCTINVFEVLKKQEEYIKRQDELLEHIKTQQDQIKEMIPKISGPKININVFLQEECKDALNWTDFLNMLEIKMYEFDLSNNISDHIIRTVCNGIQQLGIYKRPIHCIDLKRRKLCIKNENSWEHDMIKVDNTLRRTNMFIHEKYVVGLKKWEQDHPTWFLNENETENYTQLTSQIMSTIDNDKCRLEISKNVNLSL